MIYGPDPCKHTAYIMLWRYCLRIIKSLHILLYCSNVDDIVLGYIVEVLSNLGEEDSSFDVDQFSEMIAAYVPEFAEVDRYVGYPVFALIIIA